MQTRILQSAARLVKKDGYLIYATCSLLPQENQDQVALFLKNNPSFAARRIPENIPTNAGDRANMQLTPHAHHTDGFFAALLQRIKE
jgi:16S rRNA (cytosine967-C5)-methyltransferase